LNILTPNTDKNSNFYAKGKFLLAWRLFIIFGLLFSILTITAFTSSYNIQQGLAFSICLLIALGSLIYLKKTQNYNNIYYFIAFSCSLIVAVTLNGIDDVFHYGNFLWQILIIMVTYFGLGKKAGAIVSVFMILNITYYFVFSLENNLANITDLSLPIRIGLIIETVIALSAIVYLTSQFVVVHDHANKELQLANESLKQQNKIITLKNKENITLVQEVHHRVKNNLQIIVSLLRLQKNEIQNIETQKQFTEAINRIMVMSSIHQKLYQDKSFTQIAPQDYLTELTNDIIKLSSNPESVEINITSEIKIVGLKTIVPLGLIVNELVSNSIQHAFSDKKKGSIHMLITAKENDEFKLIYKDNGTWIEPAESYSSFGLELIDILASQLDGGYERKNDISGTEYNFNLKNLD
jgi:two-component sensor histidine kinase